MENTNNNINLDELMRMSLQQKVEDIIPNFRKKTILTDDQIERIVGNISFNLGITPDRAFIGIMLLFLQGAASSGAPVTMSIELGEGKVITKKMLIDACSIVTQHQYIRRIAETLAKKIGEFAANNKMPGELATRINGRHRAATGNNLSELELAYCNSFSQSIPNLAEITSERLAKLLAEDYQKRFEVKRKNQTEDTNKPRKGKKATTKPKRRR